VSALPRLCHASVSRAPAAAQRLTRRRRRQGGAGAACDRAVVLIHGFGGGTFSWRLVMGALAARAACRVVALDRPGFGCGAPRRPAAPARRMPPAPAARPPPRTMHRQRQVPPPVTQAARAGLGFVRRRGPDLQRADCPGADDLHSLACKAAAAMGVFADQLCHVLSRLSSVGYYCGESYAA